jgi:hypothetical protein
MYCNFPRVWQCPFAPSRTTVGIFFRTMLTWRFVFFVDFFVRMRLLCFLLFFFGFGFFPPPLILAHRPGVQGCRAPERPDAYSERFRRRQRDAVARDERRAAADAGGPRGQCRRRRLQRRREPRGDGVARRLGRSVQDAGQRRPGGGSVRAQSMNGGTIDVS